MQATAENNDKQGTNQSWQDYSRDPSNANMLEVEMGYKRRQRIQIIRAQANMRGGDGMQATAGDEDKQSTDYSWQYYIDIDGIR